MVGTKLVSCAKYVTQDMCFGVVQDVIWIQMSAVLSLLFPYLFYLDRYLLHPKTDSNLHIRLLGHLSVFLFYFTQVPEKQLWVGPPSPPHCLFYLWSHR